MRRRTLCLQLLVSVLLLTTITVPAVAQKLQSLFDPNSISDKSPETVQSRSRSEISLGTIANGRSQQSDSGVRKGLHDGTVDLKERSHGRGDNEATDTSNTIPYWSDSFTYQGLEFQYRMVGPDPKRGSRTTIIPTEIIPLRFVFPDGNVFDANTDLVDGQTPIQGIINSPIFQNYNFVLSGTNVGNTQYGDAFQRADFWDSVSTRARDYHVLLGQPTILPTQTILVPQGLGSYYSLYGELLPMVDEDFLFNEENSIRASLHLSPQSLPITVWGIVASERNGQPSALGWHNVQRMDEGLLTYIGASYQKRSVFDPRTDVYTLSHEIVEWMDDPFVDNFTPGWNVPFLEPVARCDSESIVFGLLETADPVEFFPESAVTLPGQNFDYHVTEAMFIDFYTRSSRSRSVNGQYSMFEIGRPFGLETEASSECVGSVHIQPHYIDFPGAGLTNANGLNNLGQVVGTYRTQSTHGYVWDKRGFVTIDFPGALHTVPYGINDAGDIAGYFIDNTNNYHGFLYSRRRWAQIDYPGSDSTVVLGINSKGDLTGSYDITQPITPGFTLRNGHFLTVATPYGSQTQVNGISDNGDITGFAWTDPNGPFYGFLSDHFLYSPLSMPDSESTFPNGLNNSGTVVGTFDGGFLPPGFIRLFGHLHEVEDPNLAVTVLGVNDSNQICGRSFDFTVGRYVGFVSDLPIKRP